MMGYRVRVALVVVTVALFITCSKGGDFLKILSVLALAAYLMSEYYMRRVGDLPKG